MAQASFVPLLMLLACPVLLASGGSHYLQDACSVTRYRGLCTRSLAAFSSAARDSPALWARAGVSVTIREAKSVEDALRKGNQTAADPRDRAALSDCVELVHDTLDNLHRSLGVLRKLSVTEFGSQLEDVATWVSAALTDEDTCVDGFEDARNILKRGRNILKRVYRVSCLTSNALALVNKLATTGPEGLKKD